MAYTELRWKRTTARVTFVLENDMCFCEGPRTTLLPEFQSPDDADLTWSIGVEQSACDEIPDCQRLSLSLRFKSASDRKTVFAQITVQAEQSVSEEAIEKRCSEGGRITRESFSLSHNLWFCNVKPEMPLGQLVFIGDEENKLTIRARVEVR